MNLEWAIKEGIRALEPVILASANRSILYIDEVNLLDDHVAETLLDCSAMGVNTVGREGVSLAHPSKSVQGELCSWNWRCHCLLCVLQMQRKIIYSLMKTHL